MSPFQHGVAVTGPDFCPRPELISALRERIDSRQNCVVKGVRRGGKTSAVLEAI
jgi:predicted AAA+ superfamily ATPase